MPITRTLNYHGTLTPEVRNALKAAKESFTWTFLLKPQAAVPGADGVVLVVDGEPEWACEYVRLESLEPDHVRLVLSSVMDGKPTVTMAEQLENMMGLFDNAVYRRRLADDTMYAEAVKIARAELAVTATKPSREPNVMLRK